MRQTSTSTSKPRCTRATLWWAPAPWARTPGKAPWWMASCACMAQTGCAWWMRPSSLSFQARALHGSWPSLPLLGSEALRWLRLQQDRTRACQTEALISCEVLGRPCAHPAHGCVCLTSCTQPWRHAQRARHACCPGCAVPTCHLGAGAQTGAAAIMVAERAAAMLTKRSGPKQDGSASRKEEPALAGV